MTIDYVGISTQNDEDHMADDGDRSAQFSRSESDRVYEFIGDRISRDECEHEMG